MSASNEVPDTLREDLRKLASQFAQKEIAPLVEADEHSETFRREIIKKAGDLGLTGIATPEALGGAGLGYREYAAVIEEIAAVSCSYAISMGVSGLPQIILNHGGTDEQKKRYVPPLARGQAIGAFSLSEAASGSDAGGLKTTAKDMGDHIVLNGTKLWTTQGDEADTIIIMAREAEGISAFILEKGTPGFKLGKREKKMGLHISHTMELVLDGAKIPKQNRVGPKGQGLKTALKALDGGRITIAACALGIARSSLKIAVSHAQSRQQFGKAIGEFQGISFLLADLVTQYEASRHLVERAASLKDQGKPYGREASMAKFYATDMAMEVTTQCIQILGGSGYTQEFPLERFMREAKVLQIVEGTNQIQRLVIGRSLMKDGL